MRRTVVMDESASSLARPIRFLFAMFQGGGNIPPILAVAQQLVAHGHRVRILAGPGLQPDRPPRPASAAFLDGVRTIGARSEERRVGKEGRSRWSPYH